ncbi:hypothetical protein BIFPSEUDO_02328 [Bifidobacterium pseudocatenulatum DSM 20438 = JCM 1200 = LMG 10505]|uniref:Uncharacterized protein n=1 Tax=Bifidobacterium pseudocatenulatum DSM 20438 = JCM 1200 = LMG 10505 TaxID=547043 RepID=C0BPP3_BIFPS|nr:hypothetical protein BIFPSEUDO_02328 [Bifidobacterium pseudocatenulatum DSM 20438 = JCM 1200 = LMG 10505]
MFSIVVVKRDTVLSRVTMWNSQKRYIREHCRRCLRLPKT